MRTEGGTDGKSACWEWSLAHHPYNCRARIRLTRGSLCSAQLKGAKWWQGSHFYTDTMPGQNACCLVASPSPRQFPASSELGNCMVAPPGHLSCSPEPPLPTTGVPARPRKACRKMTPTQQCACFRGGKGWSLATRCSPSYKHCKEEQNPTFMPEVDSDLCTCPHTLHGIHGVSEHIEAMARNKGDQLWQRKRGDLLWQPRVSQPASCKQPGGCRNECQGPPRCAGDPTGHSAKNEHNQGRASQG